MPQVQPKKTRSSDPAAEKQAVIVLILFGALFALIGAGIVISTEVLARRKLEASRKWTTTTCTILESSLKVHKQEDSETYSISVRYRYPLVEVADKNHEKSMVGERYDLLELFDTSSDREQLQKLVAELPPGTTLPCYYDPEDANQVALYRDGYDFGLLKLLSHVSFAGFGLFFMLLGWNRLRSLAKQQSPGMRPTGDSVDTTDSRGQATQRAGSIGSPDRWW